MPSLHHTAAWEPDWEALFKQKAAPRNAPLTQALANASKVHKPIIIDNCFAHCWGDNPEVVLAQLPHDSCVVTCRVSSTAQAVLASTVSQPQSTYLLLMAGSEVLLWAVGPGCRILRCPRLPAWPFSWQSLCAAGSKGGLVAKGRDERCNARQNTIVQAKMRLVTLSCSSRLRRTRADSRRHPSQLCRGWAAWIALHPAAVA